MKRLLLLVAAYAAMPVPAEAAAMPAQLGAADRVAYARVFATLRARDWATASTTLAALPAGALTPMARAELALAPGAPAIAAPDLAALLATAADLPEASDLAVKLRAEGGTAIVAIPPQQPLVRLSGASKRGTLRSQRGNAAAQRLGATIQPLLRAGDVAGAAALVGSGASDLALDAATELRARIAWAAFQAGDDATAARISTIGRAGMGEWAVQAAWIGGLANWRLTNYPAAAEAFAMVAARGNDDETIAAGLYWQARGNTAAGRPERVAPLLRTAAHYDETFYGMLAAATLGAAPPATAAEPSNGFDALLRHPNLRAAAALVEIGEPALADRLIRQQARIGVAAEHSRLIAFAAALGLPETQIWLAQFAPVGARSSVPARYPMPGWAPSGGWRVDRALLYAHALQESQFHTDAVSRAGARGVMQLMPGTARMVARHKGDPADMAERLGDPALSFEYGQSYLEELASHAGTGGLLPKVIAAYNAGPSNVALWNLQTRVQQDPLLFIEAIPFGETRAYVAIVLRNYWMYQRETGAPTVSLTALAQGQWPRFPGVPARVADGTLAAGGTGN